MVLGFVDLDLLQMKRHKLGIPRFFRAVSCLILHSMTLMFSSAVDHAKLWLVHQCHWEFPAGFGNATCRDKKDKVCLVITDRAILSVKVVLVNDDWVSTNYGNATVICINLLKITHKPSVSLLVILIHNGTYKHCQRHDFWWEFTWGPRLISWEFWTLTCKDSVQKV